MDRVFEEKMRQVRANMRLSVIAEACAELRCEKTPEEVSRIIKMLAGVHAALSDDEQNSESVRLPGNMSVAAEAISKADKGCSAETVPEVKALRFLEGEIADTLELCINLFHAIETELLSEPFRLNLEAALKLAEEKAVRQIEAFFAELKKISPAE